MNEQRKPKPAVDHIWRNLHGHDFVVKLVRRGVYDPSYDVHGVFLGRQDSVRSADLAKAWSCIGIETPAGRVMVGERRRSPSGGARMVASVEGNKVRVPLDGDLYDDPPPLWLAEAVASWPLLPAPAPITTERRIAPVLGLPAPRCACGAAMPAGCKM